MKGIKTNLFVIALINLFVVNSQTINIETNELDNKIKVETSKLIGSDDKGFYVASFFTQYKFEVGVNATGEQRVLLIQKFSNDLKLLVEKEVLQDAGETLEWPIYFGNTLYLITTKLNKKTSTWNISGQKLDNTKLFITGSSIPLYSIKKEVREYLTENSYVISPDGNFLAFHAFPSHGLGKDYSDLLNMKNAVSESIVVVYNTNMEKVWEKNIELPYKENKYLPGEVKIDNAGNVYILGLAFLEGYEKMSADEIKTKNMVHVYNNNGTAVKEINLEMQKAKIMGCLMEFDGSGNIVIAGFCNSKGNNDTFDAAFSLSIEKNADAISNESISIFSSEFHASIQPDNKVKRRFTIDHLKQTDDGGMVLLAEEYNVSDGTYTITYNHHSIIAIGIDKEHSISWVNAIPKKQYSILPEFTGYNYFISGKNIYLLYNDNRDNLNIKSFNSLDDYAERKSVIMLVTIDDSGKWKKEFLPAEINTTILRTIMSEQMNKNTFIFFEKDGKNNSVGKMSVN